MQKEQLCTRLKDIRDKHNLSQSEVADYLNISRQSISQWETGKSYPDIDNLIMLSKLYHMSVDELINTQHENNDEEVYEKIVHVQEEDKTDAISSSQKYIFEIMCLGVILVLACQIPIVGFLIPIIIAVWMKRTGRNYKMIYFLCVFSFITSIYNTYVILDHTLFDFGKSYIMEVK